MVAPSALRDSDAIKNASHHRVRVHTIGFCLETQHDAMPQDVGSNCLDIFGPYEVAPLQPGMRPRRAVDTHTGTWAGPIKHLSLERIIASKRAANREKDRLVLPVLEAAAAVHRDARRPRRG